jgi:uncharacterized delta-60 repeat protein
MSTLRKYIFSRNSSILSQIIGGGGDSSPIEPPIESDEQFVESSGYSNGSIFQLFISSDYKLYIGGNFGSYANISGADDLIATSLNGTYDSTFDANPDNNVYSISEQSTGKLIIGGSFVKMNGFNNSYLVRLNTNGTIDTSFNNNDIPIINNTVFSKDCIAVDSQDRIYVGGRFTQAGSNSASGLVRLLSDGTYDSSFDTTIGFTQDGLAPNMGSIKILSDGKILAVGSFNDYNGVTRNRIAKLNLDGTLDTSFLYTTGPNGSIFTTHELSDGSILIGGSFTQYNGTSVNKLVKVDSSGNIDNTFDIGTGPEKTNPSGTTYINDILVQPSGKIIISLSGNTETWNGVATDILIRLNSDGTLDNTWNVGGSGFVDSVFNDPSTYDIVEQENGNIIVGGRFTGYNGESHSNLVKLTSDGELV